MQDSTTYRGFEIYLSDTSRRAVCSYMVAGLRRPCRDIAHGMEIVDAHLSSGPARVGGLKVVAADVRVEHGLSASQCRNRIEQASAQKRVGGRFAKTKLTLTNPVTGDVRVPVKVGA